MAEHNTLTDPELHEPKGVASASAGTSYVADGAGSGTWTNPKITGQAGATADEVPVADGAGDVEFKVPYLHGWWDYNDNSGSQAYTTPNFTDLANDGAGTFSDDTYKIPGAGDVWDTVNNQFDWAAGGLVDGDKVTIRFDIDVTTTAANQVIRQYMDLAHGDAGEYRLQIDGRIVKAAGTVNILTEVSFYMSGATTINPAKWVLWSDANATYTVNGMFVTHHPRKPVFV